MILVPLRVVLTLGVIPTSSARVPYKEVEQSCVLSVFCLCRCPVGYLSSCLVLCHLFITIVSVTMATLALVAVHVCQVRAWGSDRLSLLLLVSITCIVIFSLVSCSLPKTHQEAGYRVLLSFPSRASTFGNSNQKGNLPSLCSTLSYPPPG